MMDFFHIREASGERRGPTLRQRRQRESLRRAALAAAIGLAVFAVLQCILSATATCEIVVAARDIPRGRVLSAADVTTVTAPASPALDGGYRTVGDVLDLVAQVGIDSGQPLFPTMARASPVVPDGSTVVDVRLAGGGEALTPGDRVDLMAADGCGDDRTADKKDTDGQAVDGRNADGGAVGQTTDDGTAHGQISGDQAADGQTGEAVDGTGPVVPCAVARSALVMGVPSRDEMGMAVVSCALEAPDAFRVMSRQERGAIIAVMAGGDGDCG